MKQIFILVAIIVSSLNVTAQKEGYRDIKINTPLAVIKALPQYKLYPNPNKKNTWTVEGDSLDVFLMDVNLLQFGVDEQGVIKWVEVITKAKIFKDYNDWQSGLQSVFKTVNGYVGSENSGNVNRESDKNLQFGWAFDHTETGLSLTVLKVDQSAANFTGNYTFFWAEHIATVRF